MFSKKSTTLQNTRACASHLEGLTQPPFDHCHPPFQKESENNNTSDGHRHGTLTDSNKLSFNLRVEHLLDLHGEKAVFRTSESFQLGDGAGQIMAEGEDLEKEAVSHQVKVWVSEEMADRRRSSLLGSEFIEISEDSGKKTNWGGEALKEMSAESVGCGLAQWSMSSLSSG